MERLGAGRGGWIITPNVDILRRLCVDEQVRGLAGPADLFVADGMPLIWASRLQGTPLPERVCGSNLIQSLSEAAARSGRSVYLLGGDPGTAEAAGRTLVERFGGLKVAGSHCPPFGFESDERAMVAMENAVVEAGPSIVFVALGFPRQERVIARLRGRLPGAWFVGVGISFSFVSGRVRRAPRWMQRVGLEWVHRMGQEPGRLIRRYLIDDIPFAVRVLCVSLGRRRVYRKTARGSG
jgi:N-acetylglucosaminyldiphosphoundecaprenol N-acetyl-beta-D-mannosaminyltransferase